MFIPERRLELLEEMRVRHAAKTVSGLPPDSPEEEEEEDGGAADPVTPVASFIMVDALVEQHAILDSIRSKAEVEANHRFLREARAERDELFADMESDEKPELWAAAKDQEASLPGLPAWRSPKSPSTSSSTLSYLCSRT
jgi:hypothetical protein